MYTQARLCVMPGYEVQLTSPGELLAVFAHGKAHGGESDFVEVDLVGKEKFIAGDFFPGLEGGKVVDSADEIEIGREVSDTLVEIGIGAGAEVAHLVDLEIYFFMDFADEGRFDRFAGVEEAAGDAEFAPGGVFGAAQEEEAALRVGDERPYGRGGVEEKQEAACAAADGVLLVEGEGGFAAAGAEVKEGSRIHDG